MKSLYKVALSKSFSWDAARHINAIIGGVRGSGKSFFALGALAQLASFPRFNKSKLLGIGTVPTQIFAVDLKNSDIARLSELLPSDRVAIDKEEAINVVTHFDGLMHQRLKKIRNYPFGATASSLHMPLYYLIIDEWSATNAGKRTLNIDSELLQILKQWKQEQAQNGVKCFVLSFGVLMISL